MDIAKKILSNVTRSDLHYVKNHVSLSWLKDRKKHQSLRSELSKKKSKCTLKDH